MMFLELFINGWSLILDLLILDPRHAPVGRTGTCGTMQTPAGRCGHLWDDRTPAGRSCACGTDGRLRDGRTPAGRTDACGTDGRLRDGWTDVRTDGLKTRKFQTAVYPPRMARIGAKLWENAFQTIYNF